MTIAALSHCKALNAAKIRPICFSESSLIVGVNDVKAIREGRSYVERFFLTEYRI